MGKTATKKPSKRELREQAAFEKRLAASRRKYRAIANRAYKACRAEGTIFSTLDVWEDLIDLDNPTLAGLLERVQEALGDLEEMVCQVEDAIIDHGDDVRLDASAFIYTAKVA